VGIQQSVKAHVLRALACAAVLLLYACSPLALDWSANTQNSISGSVVPFGGALSHGLLNPHALTCVSATASLYTLDANGSRKIPAAQTVAIQSDGSYTFTNLRALGIKVSSRNKLASPYLVEVSGCNASFARLLTATDKQDITWGTSLVSYVANTSSAPLAATANSAKLDSLYSSLAAYTSFADAYSAIQSSSLLASDLQDAIGVAPAVLQDASPKLLSITVPANMREGETAALSISTTQWDTNYNYAYEWRMDGIPFSTAPNATFIPKGNFQGSHTVSVFWGQLSGGSIDLNKPHQTQSFSVLVENNVLPSPPPLAAVSTSVNVPTVQLRLQTGASLANCDTFSALAITEDLPVAPMVPSQYNISCTTAVTQNLNYSLVGGVGTHNLYLWAIDAAGAISATPQLLNITYSLIVPNVTITAPVANLPTQNSVTVSGACDDSAGDVTFTGGITPASVVTACSSNAYSMLLNLSPGDGSKSITASQTNQFHTTGSASVTVVRDTTAPVATFTSLTPPTTNATPFTVNVNFSEPVVDFTAAKISATNGSISAFTGTGSAYSFSLTPGAQGSTTANIAAGVVHDAAGNSNASSASISRVFDTVAPSVSLASATSSPTNVASIPITVTFSEAVTGFSPAGLQLTNATVAAFSGSGSSYSFHLIPAGQGTVSVSVLANAGQDDGGNGNTASSALTKVFDSVAPTLNLSTTAPDPTNVTPIPVTAVFSESVTGFNAGKVSVTNGSVSGFTGSGSSYTFNVTPSGLGLVSLNIASGAAIDSAGNGSAAASLSRDFNNTSPSVIVSSVRSSPSNSATFPITITFSAAVTGFVAGDITISNGVISAFSGSGSTYTCTVTPSSQGAVGISVAAAVAQDSAANQNLASNNLSIVFDTVAPTIAFTAPAASSYVNLANRGSLNVAGTCSENGQPVSLSAGAATAAPLCSGGTFSATMDLTALSDGSITLNASLQDAAGNAGSAARSLIKDTSVPTAVLSGTPTSPSNATALNATVGGSGVTAYKFKVGLAATTDCSATTDYSAEIASSTLITSSISAQADGNLKICAVARNAAGNYQYLSSPTSYTWLKDTSVAAFSGLAISPATPGKNTTPSLSGNSEPNATLSLYSQAACGGAAIATATANGTGAFSLTPSASIGADGNYSFSARATDGAGNQLCSATVAYALDTIAPTVAITTTAPSATNASTIPVSVTFSEPVTGLTSAGISVSNGTLSALAGSSTAYTFSITPISQGAVTVRVLGNAASDAAGNGNTASLTLTNTYDTVAPNLTVVSPVESAYVNTPTVTFSGACETGLVVNISGSGIASATSAACTASSFSIALALNGGDGVKNITFTQTDAAGNFATITRAINLDTIAPALTFASASVQNQNTNTNYVTFSGNCETGVQISVSGTDTASVSCVGGTWSYNTATRNTDGSRPYTFTQVDAAGNSATISGSWFRDIVIPTVSLTSLNSGGVFKGGTTQTITWSASDANLTTNPISIEYTTNGGTTWLSVASSIANSGSYSWALPPVNTANAKVRILAKDPVNTGSAISAAAFSIDSSAPVVSLNSLQSGGLYKGGAAVTIAWAATDGNFGSTPIQPAYSADGGATWINIGSAIANSGSLSWVTPTGNGTNYKVRVTATDVVGFVASDVSLTPFGLDSTPPAVSLTTLNGGQTIAGNGATRAITWSASDANFGSSPIGIEYSANSGASWTSIASNLANSGTYNWTVSVADGTQYRLRITATDSVGNSATAASASDFTITSSAPNLTQTVASPIVNAGASNVTFGGACDLSTSMGGSTNITVGGTDTATIPCNGTAPSGTWSYPTANQATDGNRTYTFSQTNAAAITSTVSAQWIRDGVAPTVTGLTINNGDTYLQTTTAGVLVTAQDAAYSTGLKVRLAAGSSTTAGAPDVDCQAMYANSNWQNQTNTNTNFLVQVPDGDGYKKICAWAKDAAGNVSVISPTIGSTGVNMNVIQYANASPPQITSFTLSNASNGSSTYASGDLVKVQWTATDSLGLNNNPIKLEYTTNGSTWTTIETAYGSLSGNPTSYSATYYGFNAPSAGFFQMRISAKNVTGQTSPVVKSQSQNTGAWSIYAGNTDRGVGGSARSAVFRKNDGVRKKSFAFDPQNGDLYAFDDAVGGLMRIDAKTGIVSKFIGYGSTNLPANGTMPATPLLGGTGGMVAFDNNRMMYVAETSTARVGNSAKIYQINMSTNAVKLYIGSSGATGNDGTATPANVWVASTDFEFDESNNMYFFTSCQIGGSWSASTLATRMMKVTQTAAKNAGTISVVAGDCTKANPTSGQVATAQPLTSNGDNLFFSIAVWDNGNTIYYTDGSSAATRKIINGITFATAIPSANGLVYSKIDQTLFAITNNGGTVGKYLPNSSGASGETLSSTILTQGGTGDCGAEGTAANATCLNLYGNLALSQQGQVFFGLGSVNAPTRIGYVNSAGKIGIYAGTLPFFPGTSKELARGLFTAIYYKRASEPNQTAFPEGLYFYEGTGLIFGRMNSSGPATALIGNQSGATMAMPATGATADTNLSMGSAVSNNGQKMTFDSDGLPWLVTNFSNGVNVFSLDSNRNFVRRQVGGTVWDYASTSASPANTTMLYYGAAQNLALKKQSLFMFGRYYEPTSSTYNILSPEMRLLDFTASTITHLMGSTTTESPDKPTASPAGLGALSFSSVCYNTNCSMQFVENAANQTADDQLFYFDNDKFKVITDPTTPANSTLNTLFTAPGTVSNFIVSLDGTQVFYTLSGYLRCHALSSGGVKTWCNDSVLGPTTGLSTISKNANQLTWKDSQTLLISTQGGTILEYDVPQIP
jgi:hypothetical protein